jgi:glycosyltransferase involved in cell wall biosynthesis
MNVLMVGNGAYPDEPGGAHVYVYELSRHLAGLGHRVTVLIRKARPTLSAQEVIDGVSYVRYPYTDTRDPVRWRLRLYRGARAAFDQLARDQTFDVIHGHWPHPALGVLGHPSSRAALHAYTLHAPFFEEEQVEAAVLRRGRRLGPRQLLKAAWVPVSLYEKKATERRVLQRSNIIFTLSDFMRQRASHCFGIPNSRVQVIPGGADIARFSPVDEPSRLAIRNSLGLEPRSIVLLTVRRLVPRMGLARLVEAVKIAAACDPRIILCIGGAGPLQAELDDQIGSLGLRRQVRMLGFIPEAALPGWYRAADFFVLPSEFLEGFGLATLEAMACGTPALGTPVGGTPEILHQLDRRLLFAGTAPEQLANGIIENIRRDDLPQLRRSVAQYVRNQYSWETIARQVEAALLHELQASREGRR